MSLDTSHKFLLGLLAFALVVEREYSFKRSIVEAKNEESTLIHNHISMKEHGSVLQKNGRKPGGKILVQTFIYVNISMVAGNANDNKNAIASLQYDTKTNPHCLSTKETDSYTPTIVPFIVKQAVSAKTKRSLVESFKNKNI